MLRGRGCSVCVLEARERVGGRVLTRRERGVPIELGAEFVHGEAPLTTQVARRAGLRVAEIPGEQACVREGQLLDCEDSFGRIERALAAVSPPDRSFAELASELPWSPTERELARG